MYVVLCCMYNTTCRYDTTDEIINFTDEVIQREVQQAGLGEGGEVRAGSLMEVARRTDRNVAHAMLLCANHRVINFFTKKRPDLIKVYCMRDNCVVVLYMNLQGIVKNFTCMYFKSHSGWLIEKLCIFWCILPEYYSLSELNVMCKLFYMHDYVNAYTCLSR